MSIIRPCIVQRTRTGVMLVTVRRSCGPRSTPPSGVAGFWSILPLFACWGIVARLRMGVTGRIGERSAVVRNPSFVVRRGWRWWSTGGVMVPWWQRIRGVTVRRRNRGILRPSMRAIVICIQTRSFRLGTLSLHRSGSQTSSNPSALPAAI